jgi:hypothetical protein
MDAEASFLPIAATAGYGGVAKSSQRHTQPCRRSYHGLIVLLDLAPPNDGVFAFSDGGALALASKPRRRRCFGE